MSQTNTGIVKQRDVKFLHLRQRHNGIPSDRGGYTVAIKERGNGKFSVCLCQCNTNQRYDERLGEKVAEARLGRGQFFVQDKAQLLETIQTLHSKLSTGTTVKLNTELVDSL